MKNTSLKKILRPNIDPDDLYGIILDESDLFVLFAKEYDFFIDGYQVIRKEDITKFTSTKSCKYVYKILKTEGLLQNIEPPKIELSSWYSIFSSLGKNEFVIVENEEAGVFNIGPVTKINKKSMSLRYFDGTGVWEGEIKIKYTDITSVQFKNNYIKYHEKYIKP